MSAHYGIDEYSRYVEYDCSKDRYAIEPWPYSNLKMKFLARCDIVRWHIGMIRQHGFAEWNHLRKF